MAAYQFDPTKHDRDESGKFDNKLGAGDDAPMTASDEAVMQYIDRMKILPTIDLNSRPVVQNEDGSISTVNSITVDFDDGVFVLPTVIGNKVVDEGYAIAYFKKTGEHLGGFDNIATANSYAEDLHKAQEAQYSKDAGPDQQGGGDSKSSSPNTSASSRSRLGSEPPEDSPPARRSGSTSVKTRPKKSKDILSKARIVLKSLRTHRIGRDRARARLIKLGYSEHEADRELAGVLRESIEVARPLTRTQKLIQSWQDYP